MQGPGEAYSLFRTEDMHNYSVEFSPFRDGLLAIGASQYFGIVGNGRQYIVQKDPVSGRMQIVRFFETNDAIFDCTWNEMNENQLASACGDGSVKLWDLQTKDAFPIQSYHEHMQEVSSVDWNVVSKRSFLTASHDGTVKLWDPTSPRSLRTFQEHAQVHSFMHFANIFIQHSNIAILHNES
uniref:Peroxin-7 n=1 Tax=Aplanochytrium stocchinoi TaxID=215587 RepID=A0A7S3LPS0_9STRA